MGTIVIMVRLYSLPGRQTIELLVMYSKVQVLNFESRLD
jgi:hypothetical protein